MKKAPECGVFFMLSITGNDREQRCSAAHDQKAAKLFDKILLSPALWINLFTLHTRVCKGLFRL
jgi:hypothetical protein